MFLSFKVQKDFQKLKITKKSCLIRLIYHSNSFKNFTHQVHFDIIEELEKKQNGCHKPQEKKAADQNNEVGEDIEKEQNEDQGNEASSIVEGDP